MGPERILRRRYPGWRMPDGALVVTHPTKWANPISIVAAGSRQEAVDAYRRHLEALPELADAARAELRGHDLICWCPLDEPCHADVLLEIANVADAGSSTAREAPE